MLEKVNENNQNFFELRNEPSEIYTGLNKAQEIIIKELAKGKSYSYIAKNIFGVHYTTLKKECKSIRFVEVLSGINNAKEALTVEEIRMTLSRLVRTSNNENVVIQACKVLLSMNKSVTGVQLLEAIQEDNLSKEKAKEILESLGIYEEEEEE